MPRPYFNKNKRLASINRVDHAGEYGAVRIYSGQIKYSSEHDKPLLQEMLGHEQEHLAYFNNQISTHNYRPTLLLPLWHIGGYVMGAFTRWLNPKSAMLCTQAVEEVIEQHYAEQIEELKALNETALLNKVTQFREEELEHRDIAMQNESQNSPAYNIIYHSVQNICRIAISLSKRW